MKLLFYSLGAFLVLPSLYAADLTVYVHVDSISKGCIDTTFRQNWFIGNCLTGTGSARLESAVSLITRVGNKNGTLIWAEGRLYDPSPFNGLMLSKADGLYSNDYQVSCNSCKITNKSVLDCYCQPMDQKANKTHTTLNLGTACSFSRFFT